MIVYFMRHGFAGTKRLNPAQDDKRPLAQEGIEQCRYVGRLLNALDVHVDRIYSSPLKRATQTAYFVANEIDFEQKIETVAALKPGADYERLRQLINQNRAAEAILLVGHSPNMNRFLSLLVTEGLSQKAVDLKKGCVARVEMGAKRAVLQWMVTPRLVKTSFAAAYASAQESSRPKISKK
ncbi:MAG: phosphohistidine phosphatase SixA [Acidobacteriota bacterium]|nr:phosphohistidine phosphatase SixA [Acidobacteriota bacterium]